MYFTRVLDLCFEKIRNGFKLFYVLSLQIFSINLFMLGISNKKINMAKYFIINSLYHCRNLCLKPVELLSCIARIFFLTAMQMNHS